MGRTSKSTHPVAQVRRITGLSQKQFAEALGISRDHYARIELGTAPVSDTLAFRISREFGARVPRSSEGPVTDQEPRAEHPVLRGRPLLLLRRYTKEHYEEWKRRTEVRLSCGRQKGEAFWGALAGVLKAIGEALGDGGVDRLRVEIEGVAPEGQVGANILRRLLVAIARTEGLEIVEPMGEPAWLKPDLAVVPAGSADGPIKIFFRGKGGVAPAAFPSNARLAEELKGEKAEAERKKDPSGRGKPGRAKKVGPKSGT